MALLRAAWRALECSDPGADAGCGVWRGPPASRSSAGGEGTRRVSDLRLTAATFAHGTSLKLAFVALGGADLLLRLNALRAGYVELNPVFEAARGRLAGLFVLKLAGPVAIAWLVPSIALLSGVLGWNVGALLAPT